MKLLGTISMLALLSACAVNQPDPCLNNNTADCSDRIRAVRPEPPTEEPWKEPEHPHDTVGDPIDLDDEPDSESDPEGYREWRDAVERQREIDAHTREIEEAGLI